MKAFLTSMVVLGTLSTAFGCHQTELQIQLPPTFSGHVVLYCAEIAAPSTPIVVDSSGHATGAPCSDPSTRILILRGNQRLTPNEVHWLKTGDNIPTGLEFNVR